ncbi:uncharacterized protein LOC143861621 [Tasmannia lanceolata]|uniref:uncharacterized protein LOC143861621 n=1 Tax=Tasmannia lanceolata TaxID=3420 RepID=UPI004063C50C
MTFALIKEELKRGQIHCSEFEEEAELVALGVSRATPAQMVKQMSLLDRIKQTSGASPAQEQPQTKGKKRKVPESTPPMVALAKPLKSSRATHKLALSSRADTPGQSSKSGATTGPKHGGAVLGIAAAASVGGDNVFRPNWAVQKTDTGLGDTRVATELMYKGVLPRDRLEVEKEVPETCEAAISSALYQLQVYSRDMAKKRYLFSETITRIESEKAQLQKENDELTEALQIKEAELNSLQDELQRVKNQAVQDLLSSAERAGKKEKAAVEKAEDMEMTPQVNDFKNLRSKLANEKIVVCDPFRVGAIIYKLPSAWHSFKTEMYRKKVQVGLDDLKRFIRIEDENRAKNNLEMVRQQQSAANTVINPKQFPSPLY